MQGTTQLRRLSTLVGRNGLSELKIPTITEDAEGVTGMQGRIRLQKDEHMTTSRWMDNKRLYLQAYEYLCHIGEAKQWIESCIQTDIGPIIELEETLRNGIILAKLANWFAPGTAVKIYTNPKLQFRHTDNINYFLNALKIVRLPKTFEFELVDLYEKKNIPRVIYCIHALSHLLEQCNRAPGIVNLVGKLEFTDEELKSTQRNLDSSVNVMPNFRSFDKSLGWPTQDSLDDCEPFQPIDMAGGVDRYLSSPMTPDLIIEGDDESDPDLEDHEALGEDEEHRIETVKRRWEQHESFIVRCQTVIRARAARQEVDAMRKVHRSTFFISCLSNVQAQARGMLTRKKLQEKQILYENASDTMTQFQAAARGYLARMRLKRTREHYANNIDKIAKIQNFVKKRLTSNAYQRLSTEENPSLSTVKSFIHLLDDSDLDYDTELALEEMRQQVIEHIRENNQLDAHLNALDIQIGLFLRNAITIDEVIKTSGAFKKKLQQRRMSELAATNTLTGSPFALNGIDKASRRRLQLYQQMVYVLQTEPEYLARLLSMAGRQNLGQYTNLRLMESTVLTLFGYATKAREEYLLVNLCKRCIQHELELVESSQEFIRGQCVFMKLAVQTNRGTKERTFFRELLNPLIQSIIQDDTLDLETDPIAIYKKAINEEERQTGYASRRPLNVSSQDAMGDPQVRNTLIHHLRQLQRITTTFLDAIMDAVSEVPYGIRVIARHLWVSLEEAFPSESKDTITRMIASFIYYRYINPAVIAPEQYDVIDEAVLPLQRKNLGEVGKMLHHISSGQPFGDNDLFLKPLNAFVEKSSSRFTQWFSLLTDVEEPEQYFGMHELNDQISTDKPMVYISPFELFHLHHVIFENMDHLDEDPNGILRSIVEQLGPSPFSPDIEFPDSMVCLSLADPFEGIPNDPMAKQQQLIMDVKRLVIYVIRIQSGPNLRDIFEAPVEAEHEEAWQALVAREFSDSQDRSSVAAKRRFMRIGNADTLLDLKQLEFSRLKALTERLVHHLAVRCGVLSTEDNYQGMINMIARDITGKNTRRQQRTKELNRVRTTLTHLKIKQQYLAEQRKDYEGYLNSCMKSMAEKHGKRQRYTLPFTRQYFHIRGLQKQGMVPCFGSFKYTAKQLHDRGVLVEVADLAKKQYDKIFITLSMQDAGVINIEGSYSGWSIRSVQMDMRYEELLLAQFDGEQIMTVLDGVAKVNVNLFIYLINKKFYA